MNRTIVFDAMRDVLLDRGLPGFSHAEVRDLDAAFDRAMQEAGEQLAKESGRAMSISDKGLAVSQRCIDLLHKWEGCHRLGSDGLYHAYPDPGSADGHPWTIGWGSTGPGIRKGTKWTKAQCDKRFAEDLPKYADEVKRVIGDAPTTQGQFDALVSFHYNTGKIGNATLTRKHKAGDYVGAAEQFGRWVFNDGRRMKGLVNRRRDEAELYASR